MIRKSRIRPKEEPEDPETNASSRVDRGSDASSIARLILDTSPVPTTALAGSNHTLRYVNTAFCRLACRTQDELTGKPFAEVLAWEGCLVLLNRVYNSGEITIHAEPTETEPHSAGRFYTMWPVPGAAELLGGVVMQVTETPRSHQRTIALNEQLLLSGVRQHELREAAESLNAQLQSEITDRKKLEQALLNSEKLAVTARFALTMAHEINNPLEAITNLVYLLAPMQVGPEAQAYIATMEDQLKGLSRISTQMLKFHRGGNRPALFQLSAVVCEIADFYRHEAERKAILVLQRLDTDGEIVAFRSEIVQVITNLLLNALDATPDRGRVIIHLYPAPRWLREGRGSCGYCLSIADSGSGIATQDRARIYQPFFTTKGERGTGLGLWVSAGIVNRIGGSIRVWSSLRPGRSGTCFSVFLPVEESIFAPLRRRRGEPTDVQGAR